MVDGLSKTRTLALRCGALNNAQSNGGGINVSAGVPLTIENCEFLLNSADFGGAINFADDTSNRALLVVRNSIFQNNFSNTQAAGINVVNADVELYNCLFFNNSNLNPGAGGAISNNAAGERSQISAYNYTIAENTATIGGSIAQWQDSTDTCILQLQNTILYGNFDSDYKIESGAPTVASLGGNLCGDLSLASVLTATNDRVGVDPQFADPSLLNYRLKSGSLCIDRGVSGPQVPPTDLGGNPRDSNPDQGCYEFQTVSAGQPTGYLKRLVMTPNPATDVVRFEVSDEWAGPAVFRLFNATGVEVQTFSLYKPAGLWAHTLPVGDLPAGASRRAALR